MIDLKLAEQLKENGFPQEPIIEIGGGCDGQFEMGGFYFIAPKEATCGGQNFLTIVELENLDKDKYIAVKLPTLSELIKACINLTLTTGEGMETAHFELTYSQVEKSRGWRATIGDEGYFRKEKPELVNDTEGTSEHSSEEAVAKLWLILKNATYPKNNGAVG